MNKVLYYSLTGINYCLIMQVNKLQSCFAVHLVWLCWWASIWHKCFPQVLLPLNGPGFEEQRAHMLIGVIVRAKSKRVFDHTTGNWKVVSGGHTVPSHKTNGKYGGGEENGIIFFPAPRPDVSISNHKKWILLWQKSKWEGRYPCRQKSKWKNRFPCTLRSILESITFTLTENWFARTCWMWELRLTDWWVMPLWRIYSSCDSIECIGEWDVLVMLRNH